MLTFHKKFLSHLFGLSTGILTGISMISASGINASSKKLNVKQEHSPRDIGALLINWENRVKKLFMNKMHDFLSPGESRCAYKTCVNTWIWAGICLLPPSSVRFSASEVCAFSQKNSLIKAGTVIVKKWTVLVEVLGLDAAGSCSNVNDPRWSISRFA